MTNPLSYLYIISSISFFLSIFYLVGILNGLVKYTHLINDTEESYNDDIEHAKLTRDKPLLKKLRKDRREHVNTLIIRIIKFNINPITVLKNLRG